MSGLFGTSINKKNNNTLFGSNEDKTSIFDNLESNNEQKSNFSSTYSIIFNLNSNNQNLFFTSQSKNNENEKGENKNEDKTLFKKKEEEEEENEEKRIKIIHINEYFIYINEKIVIKSIKFQKLKKILKLFLALIMKIYYYIL